jgi:hypothetical protein
MVGNHIIAMQPVTTTIRFSGDKAVTEILLNGNYTVINPRENFVLRDTLRWFPNPQRKSQASRHCESRRE